MCDEHQRGTIWIDDLEGGELKGRNGYAELAYLVVTETDTAKFGRCLSVDGLTTRSSLPGPCRLIMRPADALRLAETLVSEAQRIEATL